MRSATPPGSPRAAEAAPAGWQGGQTALRSGTAAPPGDAEESRLEQLVGVHSSKTGYYAQWRGTRQDLQRALAALRSLSEALCVTSLGPVALCNGVLRALGQLFDAEWAVLVLAGQEMPSTVPSYFAWRRDPVTGAGAPSAQQATQLAARIVGQPEFLATSHSGPGSGRGTVALGAAMRLDYRRVGSLLVGIGSPGGQDGRDGIGISILETVANQIVVALRNAWLYEHSEQLRRRAEDGWTEAERRAEELTRRNEQLRRARGRLARARQAELVSAERHRIARDLHDGVAQCLVGIGMHLEWCHRHTDPSSPAYRRLVASKELARSGLGGVRAAVAELSGPERRGTGLGQALRGLAADFRAGGTLRVGVRVVGRQRPLAPEVEHSLFQISQEGLWNVVRHAGAGGAWVQLRYAPGEIHLSIADDGAGDPAMISRHLSGGGRANGRHGLRNMAERAAELGGEVRAERRRGGGLRIAVRIPDGGSGPADPPGR